MRHLQEEFGVDLIEKVGKKIYLTEAGELLKEKANAVFLQLREAEYGLAEMKGLLKGSVHMAASTTIAMYVLRKPLSDFGHKYPGIKVHLRTGNSASIEAMVAAMEVDVGFSVGIPASGVSSTTFMEDEIVLVLQPKHPLARKQKLYPSDLCHETFVLRGANSATWRSFEQLFKNPNARPNIQMILDNNQAVKWAVAEGLGISLIPQHAVLAEAKAGIFVLKRVHGHCFPCPLNVITHPQRKLSTAAKTFLELVTSRCLTD